MKLTLKISVFLFLLLNNYTLQAQNKILFDASKGESAGNADWIIDADLHNLGVGSSGPYIGGQESNPQRFPNPPQSTITAITQENYWDGALSYWAIDCVKQGYNVETLPWNGLITYGVSSNLQDLSNYKAFIIDEPNILFTASEKTALINYVNNGGGLFIISDHNISDRNGDGYDSVAIWNDLFSFNYLGTNPFGITFDLGNFSGTFTNIANLPTDPILHGSAGNVTKVKWSSGTSMALNTTLNSTVKGVVYRTGNSGLSNVLCAYGTYGSGKFVAVGDSSITDDGTGDVNDILYDGYITGANGNHQRLLMNITNWLMGTNLSTSTFTSDTLNFTIAPNPIEKNQLKLSYNLLSNGTVKFTIYNNLGYIISTQNINAISGNNFTTIENSLLSSGLYFVKIESTSQFKTLRFFVP